MYQRSMTGNRPRHHAAEWPQTIQMRRPARRIDNPYRRKHERPAIDWTAVFLLGAAIFLTVATLVYKFTGPA